jgi:nucleoside-diphosphate-sugar epimerase
MNLNTKFVLVTGAAGWLGSRLVESLVRGLPEHDELKSPAADLRIRVMLLPGQDAAPLKKISDHIEVVTGDIRNAADCARFCADANGAILFHTAGIIHPRKVSEFFAVNRDGTTNLLDAVITSGVKRAVIVSSNSPCGCNPHPDHLFDELSPFNPYMNYGRSKMEMELAVRERADKIETVLIRAPWFYGPNQPPRQTLFFQMVRDGKGPIVGSGNNLRSMAYVDNLCQGLILAAIRERAAGQVYWIADKRPYSMNEIMDTIERLLEKEFGHTCKHKRMKLPGFASEVAWLADKTLQALGIYHQKIHVLSEMNKTIACSVTRAEKELGYRPTVALEEGMRRSLRWCQENGQTF